MQKSASQPGGPVLDPRTLGRPIHLLGNFAAPFQDDLAEVLRSTLNRRYRASFEVVEVTIAPLERIPEHCRWTAHTNELGRIEFAMERQVLLCALNYRYGIREAATGHGKEAPRETVTEERLAMMLGRQFVGTLVDRIEQLGSPGREPRPDGAFAEAAIAHPKQGAWAVRAQVRESVHGVEGALWFVLDEAWMQHLLERLAPARDVAKKRTPVQPFPRRLHLQLVARLLEKDIPLGRLLDMQVGDVIPVSMKQTDVLIQDSRLFTAHVVEHKGKLCLTAFEDVE